MGWVARRRDLGNLLFFDVRDRTGIVQVVFNQETQPAAHAKAEQARGEFVVAVEGKVLKRQKANPELSSGEVELVAAKLHILNNAKTPPFPIEDEINAAEETRLRFRYLDLRRPKPHRNLALRHKIILEIRKVMDEMGFVEVETPMLTRSTPEGARDFLVPSRIHHGSFYALPQSPQIFKQILMVAGMDKYFQVARCFRDEDLRADRQPEFTQVDVEMSYPRVETIIELIEPLFQRLTALVGVEVARPFPRLTYAEAMERYGSDKPDMRFGMEISDVTEEMSTLGLDTFPGLIAAGARARAIVLPSAGGVSGTRLRKINEDTWLGRIVPDARASKRNLVSLKATDESVGNLVKKGAREDVARRLFAKAGAGRDDTVLVAVDEPAPLAMSLGILRLEMGGVL